VKNRSFETGRYETRVLEACLTEHCVFEVRAHDGRAIEMHADSVCIVETGKVELCCGTRQAQPATLSSSWCDRR
jgi:hypothetical protein